MNPLLYIFANKMERRLGAILALAVCSFSTIFGQNVIEGGTNSNVVPIKSSNSSSKTNGTVVVSTTKMAHTTMAKPETRVSTSKPIVIPTTASKSAEQCKVKLVMIKLKIRRYQSEKKEKIAMCEGTCFSTFNISGSNVFSYEAMYNCCRPDDESTKQRLVELKHMKRNAKKNFTITEITGCKCLHCGSDTFFRYKRPRFQRPWMRWMRRRNPVWDEPEWEGDDEKYPSINQMYYDDDGDWEEHVFGRRHGKQW